MMYYYELLNKEQQKAYYAIKNGLENLEDSFAVPMLSKKELSDIYFCVRLDNPKIFYTTTFSYRYYPDSSDVEMIPEYMFTKEKIKEHQKAMTSRIEKLTRPALNMEETEKQLYIHDFICNNIKYDKLKKAYSHEIIGALGNGVAVCEGIAKAVKVLCDVLGIWCIVVVSENNPEKQIKYRHAWNICKINGRYYHLDATFDNTLTRDEVIRYDYVNLSDKQIYRDHEPSIWKVPACEDGDCFYYKTKKISWTTMDDVRNRTRQAVKKGKTLLFHWRGGYMTRDVLKEILEIFESEANQRNKVPMTSVNMAQAVLKVKFVEDVKVQQLMIESANEGEEEI